MKATRVYTTLAVLGGLLVAFFLVPLPVSRVRETGLIVIDYNSVETVALEYPARLLVTEVKPGELVRKGQVLGRFRSEELELAIDRAVKARDGKRRDAELYERNAARARADGSESAAKQFSMQAALAKRGETIADDDLQRLFVQRAAISELKAPRDGMVVAVPPPGDRNKLYDRGFAEAEPLFSVGDPTKLILRVPVSPPDYRLIKEDLDSLGELDVSIYVKGRSDRQFHGKVRWVPRQNAATVPIQLTQRGGGPLALKPGGDPNVFQPLAQVYLVDVEMLDPDVAVDPGQLASVKIHTKWRSAAWWLGRTIANALDLGLY